MLWHARTLLVMNKWSMVKEVVNLKYNDIFWYVQTLVFILCVLNTPNVVINVYSIQQNDGHIYPYVSWFVTCKRVKIFEFTAILIFFFSSSLKVSILNEHNLFYLYMHITTPYCNISTYTHTIGLIWLLLPKNAQSFSLLQGNAQSLQIQVDW